MSLVNQVMKSLSWKKNDEICARRLGISLEEYKNLKPQALQLRKMARNNFKKLSKEVFTSKVLETKQDLEKGTGEIKALSVTEPKSPEEVEEILMIKGSDKWKLSSYWNKQQPNGTWLISGQVTSIKQNDPTVALKELLNTLQLNYQPVTQTLLNRSFSEPTCAVLSLQDIHVGKKTINPHTLESDVKRCVETLILKAHHSNYLDKIVFVLGGDLVNMDTYTGTTTGGTLVENEMPAYDAYKIAFELMYWSVNFLKQFCNELQVVYIPGNHSRLTEAHIAYSLSRCIQDPNIVWDIEYAERKVVVYGKNMLCFEHGDFDAKKSPLIFATEYATEWGQTSFRTLYTGHYHKKKKLEYITEDEITGFTMKILPSLSATDMYHYSGKWTCSKRGGVIVMHSKEKGQTGEFSWYE